MFTFLWQDGVIKGMVSAADPDEMEYDVVTGISSGALNALGVAMFPKGQESEMAEYLYDFWMNMDSKKVYKGWPLGIIQGIFERGLYDNSVFAATLDE